MKHIVILAAAGMALVGCVKNEQPPIDAAPSDKPISFEAPVISKAPVSRASTEAYPDTESFKVWGWWYADKFTNFDSKTDYMNTQGEAVEVKKPNNQSYWVSTPPYYWPKSGSLTFAAYSPASLGDQTDVTVKHEATGLSIEGFSVPENADMDVMYSDRAYDKTSNENSSNIPDDYTGVQINFHHALSMICFQGKTAADYSETTPIRITKITVKNVKNKGTFNQGITRENDTDKTTPDWKLSEEANNSSKYVAFEVVDDETNENKGVLSTSVIDLGKGDQNKDGLILMPQTFREDSSEEPGGDDGDDPSATDETVEIEFTMNGAKQQSTFALGDSKNVAKWKPGCRYTYIITIGLDEIHFAPVITDWENATVPEGGGNLEI